MSELPIIPQTLVLPFLPELSRPNQGESETTNIGFIARFGILSLIFLLLLFFAPRYSALYALACVIGGLLILRSVFLRIEADERRKNAWADYDRSVKKVLRQGKSQAVKIWLPVINSQNTLDGQSVLITFRNGDELVSRLYRTEDVGHSRRGETIEVAFPSCSYFLDGQEVVFDWGETILLADPSFYFDA